MAGNKEAGIFGLGIGGLILVVCLVLVGCVAVVGFFVFICSFHIVEDNHIGLKYDKNNFKVKDSVWENGRHLSGPGMKFVQYPITIQYMEFVGSASRTYTMETDIIGMPPADEETSESDTTINSQYQKIGYNTVNGWSLDGQNIYLQVSYFYRVKNEGIYDLYMNYGEYWVGFLARITYTKIKEISTTFHTLDFFTQRQAISTAILNGMRAVVLEHMGNSIEIDSVQLRDVDVDYAYENSIQEKLIALQSKRQAEVQQQIDTIKEEINQINAETTAEVNLIYAESEAQALQIRGIADAQADQILFGTETQAYQDANADIAIYSAADQDRTHLFQFMYVNSMRYIDNDISLFMGFEKPIIQVAA